MTDSTDQPEEAGRHEEPEVGLIADEELPEDLRPTDDNPLAKDPDDSADGPGAGISPGGDAPGTAAP